jgi:pentatricopeptide repeat protein
MPAFLLSSGVSRQQTVYPCNCCPQAIKHEVDNGTTEGKRSATYSAAMAACEKAGQWELAVKLFDKVTATASCFVALDMKLF